MDGALVTSAKGMDADFCRSDPLIAHFCGFPFSVSEPCAMPAASFLNYTEAPPIGQHS